MKKEYDFSNSVKNPYLKAARKSVTMNIDVSTIEYFKNEAAATGVPYQSIMNFYLGQCAREQKHLTMQAL